MKRLPVLLAALLLAFLPALADPLPLDEDLTETIVVPYDENDPSAGSYTYSFRFPHIADSDPDASLVNSFYTSRQEELETNVYFLADGYADSGRTASTSVTYQVTCNNDDYFSVLITTDFSSEDYAWTSWQGHTFSRKLGTLDATFDLARLLGLLEATDQDEYQQAKQTEKASLIVRSLVMDQIRKNPDGIPFYEDLSEEDLLYAFSPEEDFYLDEYGDPVFFVAPGTIADESLGYLTFPVPLEDIEDEL